MGCGCEIPLHKKFAPAERPANPRLPLPSAASVGQFRCVELCVERVHVASPSLDCGYVETQSISERASELMVSLVGAAIGSLLKDGMPEHENLKQKAEVRGTSRGLKRFARELKEDHEIINVRPMDVTFRLRLLTGRPVLCPNL